MMQLVSVDSAKQTATPGTLELSITADIGAGAVSMPYGWRVGDPYGLGPQVDAYMTANPTIGQNATPYVPPTAGQISADDQAAINATLAEPGSIIRALALVLLQRINACDAAINALNTKTALGGNNLPIFTQQNLVAALQAQIR